MTTTIAKRVARPLGRGVWRPGRDRAAVSSLPNAAAWSGWLFGAMSGAVLLYAIDILADPVPSRLAEPLAQFAACSVFFGAAALCAMKARASGDERWAWWLVALAMVLWGAGSAYYAVGLWGGQPVPGPSPADALWLAFYLPAYAVLYKLLRLRIGSVGSGVWLDALVVALGVGGAAAALAFQGVLERSYPDAIAAVTSVAYPIGDIGLVGLVVAAVTVTGWKAAGTWRLIATAFAMFAVGNGIYAIQVVGRVHTVGRVVDLTWLVAALLVGLAAWGPQTAPRSGVPARSIAVPALGGVAAIALLALDHFVALNPVAVVLATAAGLVSLVRLYLAVHDKATMLTHSQREAATDALTGLGNRRQLSADLDASLSALDPDRPLIATLFDLNGFRYYNDTFGHLAGDQLLQRLGSRLRELMGAHGTAYRLGDDEFCAVWTLSHHDRASPTPADAAAALSESGGAFSIDCCYGSALLPNDTTDPSAAVQIADRRMYIHKRSMRTSAGQRSSEVLLRALTERDSDLGIHVGGVAELACATAIKLDVSQNDVEATEQTALLHDVGKFAIPDRILKKKGPLDDAEWAFMKQHTLIGQRIISAAPALANVARLVRSTHERYDGRGYPDGLAGDAIPLVARIVAVCDAYDAIVTRRAYRDSRSPSLAIAELRRCAGTQFDPDVVDALASQAAPAARRWITSS